MIFVHQDGDARFEFDRAAQGVVFCSKTMRLERAGRVGRGHAAVCRAALALDVLAETVETRVRHVRHV